MKKISLVLIIVFSFWHSIFAQQPINDLKPTIILISLDGFRYDYLDKYKAKNLKKMAQNGVRAKWLIPSFPTKTFPNHYTIATGLYPEHHGIIENNIYDFGTVFTLGKREEVQNSRWWLGEPIWVTAEKQGQKAGAFFFPGTEAEIKGVRPTFWKTYDGKIPNETRVDTILSWLDLPVEQRPTLYTLYFSDTDDAGHEFSPDSIHTKMAVSKVDNDLGRLVRGLKKRRIYKKINLIITSDHGMATVDFRNAVFLDEYINFDDTERILWTNEIVQIFPKSGKEFDIINKLKTINHAQCWKKSEIPERLHYDDSPRIAPIICSTEEGWITTSHRRYEELKARTDLSQPHGGHGYDNKYLSMQATFIAHGAAFRKNYIAEPFENIQIYNLMCRILGLQPAPNDGDFEKIKDLLKSRANFK
ncbi:MAG: alkaline phosphatase family protein [Acidobacteria bacterium]|jgi:predicted AlkP superfamily pyrophosphatase or phosphodiesterase|nr:alkaline phosphatase family protein [Acidobacteriota bacterium]